MKRIERSELIKAFNENGWKALKVTCPDGTVAEIVPCGSFEMHGDKDVEYYLVYWDIPWSGNEDLDKIIEELNGHEDLVEELKDDKSKLKAFFEKWFKGKNWDEIDPDNWGYYSDWHKDVYGYRPHGIVCGAYVSPY